MFPATLTLGSSIADGLRQLSRRPAVLVAFMLLLNALFMPYLGIVHDAQIYSGLVLNRIDPQFLAGDLFFRFGSQDSYSIFSPLAAPLVLAIGLKPAFFVLYFASIAFLFAALVRFVVGVWPDSPGAVAGLIMLAIVPVGYGGYVPLHVVEPFLTARPLACGLMLSSLALGLERRWFAAGLFLAAAAAVHPLMAVPGVLLAAAVFVQSRFGLRGLLGIGLLTTIALAAILATPAVAARLFGHVDAEWFEINRQTNCYQFPLDWSADQWFINLFSIGGLAAAAYRAHRDGADARSRMRSRVLTAAALVGVAGFFGCLVFTQFTYALLLKGQAYRWLWLPMALAPAALFDLSHRLWTDGRPAPRVAAVAILATLGISNYAWLEVVLVLLFVPVFLYALRTLHGLPWREAAPRALLASVVVGIAVWGFFRAWIYWSLCDFRHLEPFHIQAHVMAVLLAVGVLFPLALAAVAMLRPVIARRGSALVLVGAALVAQIGLFTWTQSERYRLAQPEGAELAFVDSFLADRQKNRSTPLCVYSDFGKLGQVWVEWGTRSYYDSFQLAGFVFNRDTALEGKRRCRNVAPFEAVALASGGWDAVPDLCKQRVERWLDRPVGNDAAPTIDDLRRLASDPAVDVVVLFRSRIDGAPCIRHGAVSIYDCRALREDRLARRTGEID